MVNAVKVVLGPTYEPTLWDLRKRVTAARKAGEQLIFVSITAPIVSETIEVAIESGSLYLIGIRSADGPWFEFVPDAARPSRATAAGRPRLPNSRWIMAGANKALSSYRALRLGWHIDGKPGATGQVAYAEDPGALLRFFRIWDGQVGRYDAQLHTCVLIFAVCEALRFRSIESACAGWARPIIGPAGGRQLVITRAMLDTVQNWHERAEAGNPDVWTWPPEMPDRIII